MHSVALRYLDEVARQGSFRKAGAVLGVTSSAVNRQILKIEAELGLRLFDRKPDGIELTAAGRLMLDHARQTLNNYDRIRARVLDIKGMRAGQLSISCINSLAFDLIPDILERFGTAYPDITFVVRDDPAERILQALEDESFDIGLTFAHFHHPGARLVADIPAMFGAVVAPDHPLAGRQSVTLEDCLDHPLVRTFSPAGKHTFVEDEAHARGLEPDVGFHTNSMVMAKRAIKLGRCIGIYMKHGVLGDLAAGELAFVPLVQSAMSDYRIGLFISARKAMDDADRRFLKIARAVFKTYEAR